ncbi:MAG: disulfide bond formation protein B [Vitreoscilla sp.]|nr:disulfide bond formation protein B [Vitreoscilla sp.]
MDGWLYRPAPLLSALAVVCFGAVGLALVSQYQFDMQPCPWCTLQRLIFLLIGALALLGALVRSNGIRRVLSAGGLLLALCGMASAIWQHFVAAASASCNLTLADRIMQALRLYDLAPEVFAPMASCADAAVNLLGVPYAFWSLALFVLCAAICAQVMRVARI